MEIQSRKLLLKNGFPRHQRKGQSYEVQLTQLTERQAAFTSDRWRQRENWKLLGPAVSKRGGQEVLWAQPKKRLKRSVADNVLLEGFWNLQESVVGLSQSRTADSAKAKAFCCYIKKELKPSGEQRGTGRRNVFKCSKKTRKEKRKHQVC